MRISLEALPSTSKFFLDYVRHWDRVGRFYSHDFSLDSIAGFARECAAIDPRRRNGLASALEAQQRRWAADTSAVERLASGAVAIVAGQQAGLFTGPMYSILKAVTAVKLARHLESRGIPAVPVFWIASEDHDDAEISWAGILDGDAAFRTITAEIADGAGTPVGWLRFPPSVVETIRECFESLPPSRFRDEVRFLVEFAYQPGSSPVDAFARMMARLFEGTGLILVDRLDPALRSLSEDILSATVRSMDGIRSAVLERTRMIEEAGYPPQVRVDEDFTGLFVFHGRSRRPWLPGEASMPPSDLSPNVLLRPLVQDALFPTAAYIGGPAEIAYFAQAGAIYDCLGKSMPPVFPRITATLVEPPAARVLKKYGFGIEEVFEGADRLKQRVVGSSGEAGVFDEVHRRVREETERLRPVLGAADRTLEGALDNALHKIMHQLNTLRSRFLSAESKRDAILDRQIRGLVNRLFPERKPQERLVNVTSFLVRYGFELVPLMDRHLDLDGTVHQVVEL